MVDNTLALRAPGFQRARGDVLKNRRSELQNLLLQEQVDAAPLRADQAATKTAQAARTLAIREQQAQAQVQKGLREATAAERTEGLNTAAQFATIADQAGLQAFIANNPIDARDSGLIGAKFGDPIFTQNKANAAMILSAGRTLGLIEKEQGPLSSVAKIQADVNAGRITPAQGQAAITKATTSGPLVTVQTGDQIGAGKATTTKLEGNLVQIGDAFDRINSVIDTFDPSFLNVGTRFNAAKTALKDKFSGTVFANFLGEASEAEKQQLAAFSAFKQTAISNINKGIKDLTGAAMSEPEAVRIRQGMPDPGEGIFDGDSPTEFQAKLNGTIRDLNRARARTTFALTQGLNFESIPLPAIDAIIDRRDSELAAQGMSEADRDVILKREFGL